MKPMLWLGCCISASLLSNAQSSMSKDLYESIDRFRTIGRHMPNGLARMIYGRQDIYTAGAKPYTGRRFSNESLRMIYWYDQTVAVVELGPKKLLLNCELIGTKDDGDERFLLWQLSRINRPLEINFDQMEKLMSRCQQISASWYVDLPIEYRRLMHTEYNHPSYTSHISTMLKGIAPGTYWCGSGDLAQSYYELGTSNTDLCCRTHDFCPVSVRAYAHRYNLTNDSKYTRSHCRCDEQFFSCLKNSDSLLSYIVGDIYFNMGVISCLEDLPDGTKTFRAFGKSFKGMK